MKNGGFRQSVDIYLQTNQRKLVRHLIKIMCSSWGENCSLSKKKLKRCIYVDRKLF